MGPVVELFGEYIRDIQFNNYVYDLYFILVDTLLDVVFP